MPKIIYYRRTICVTTQFVGFHRWLEAPVEVSFLRNKHRHIFNVKCYFEVNHNNRDLEFFMMKNLLERCIEEEVNFDDCGSCEMMAENIIEYMQPTPCKVEVWEDNENGAIIERR